MLVAIVTALGQSSLIDPVQEEVRLILGFWSAFVIRARFIRNL